MHEEALAIKKNGRAEAHIEGGTISQGGRAADQQGDLARLHRRQAVRIIRKGGQGNFLRISQHHRGDGAAYVAAKH